MIAQTLRPLVLAVVLTLAAASPAVAAGPAGPETSNNCSFVKGITTCTYVGDPVYSEKTSEPDRYGCTAVTYSATETTSYTAHRGPFNAPGPSEPAPDPSTRELYSYDGNAVCPRDITPRDACERLGLTYAEPGGHYYTVVYGGFNDFGPISWSCDGNVTQDRFQRIVYYGSDGGALKNACTFHNDAFLSIDSRIFSDWRLVCYGKRIPGETFPGATFTTTRPQ